MNIDKVWLGGYIKQVEHEVQENKHAGYDEEDGQGLLECPEDYYLLGIEHGEQAGILNTLKLIKGML